MTACQSADAQIADASAHETEAVSAMRMHTTSCAFRASRSLFAQPGGGEDGGWSTGRGERGGGIGELAGAGSGMWGDTNAAVRGATD